MTDVNGWCTGDSTADTCSRLGEIGRPAGDVPLIGPAPIDNATALYERYLSVSGVETLTPLLRYHPAGRQRSRESVSKANVGTRLSLIGGSTRSSLSLSSDIAVNREK